MSLGQMITFINIVDKTPGKDAEGFAVDGETILASVRAYKEDRHGSVAWKNRATFSTASSRFLFRVIPGLIVTTAMIIVCGDERYKILSAENVKGRGMYIEALTERVMPSG